MSALREQRLDMSQQIEPAKSVYDCRGAPVPRSRLLCAGYAQQGLGLRKRANSNPHMTGMLTLSYVGPASLHSKLRQCQQLQSLDALSSKQAAINAAWLLPAIRGTPLDHWIAVCAAPLNHCNAPPGTEEEQQTLVQHRGATHFPLMQRPFRTWMERLAQ